MVKCFKHIAFSKLKRELLADLENGEVQILGAKPLSYLVKKNWYYLKKTELFIYKTETSLKTKLTHQKTKVWD